MDLIPKIRELRLSRGYTRSRLAAMLDIPYPTLTNYENGTRTPPLSTLVAVADLFGVTVDSLLGREAPRENAHHQIAALRKSAGLSQAELAREFGIAQNTLSQYETGTRPLPAEISTKAALLFGVSEGDVHGTDDRVECSPNTQSAIAERIRGRRVELGLSLQAAAEVSGISKSTLQRYETGGIRNIPLHQLDGLARALGVSKASMLGFGEETEDDCLNERVCDRINLARISAGLTQADVAAALGMTPQGISNYERGLNRIPGDVLCGMASLFGVSVEYLLTGHTPAQQWISTIDRLPESGKKVIVCRDTGYVTMDIYIGYWHKLGPYPSIETTHWMPLPEVPE